MPGLGAAATVAAGSNDLPPGVRMDSASTTAGAKGKPKLDTSDPRVRKLVYSMYRDFLTTYNGEANDISKKDPAKVSQDSGVGPILESIIIRQRSTQGGGSDSTEPLSTDNQPDSETTNGTGADTMPPPPPPPPMMPGRIPAVRLNSEIGQQNKGPPSALASAMMKDKKPFTYTPGGIDLSEIRSPRMAKRIQMNAAAEGVTNTPKPSANNNQERAPCHLPPAALAAMQPQMAIPVFPQGNLNEVLLNRMHNKQVDYAAPKPSMPAPRPPPPPPAAPSPPPTIMPQQQSQPSPPSPKSPQPPSIRTPPSPPPMQSPPPPPPVMPTPVSPPARQTPASPPAIQTPTPPPVAKTPPPPPERAATPKSPVPITDSYLGDSRPTSQSSNQEERRSPLDRKSPALEAASTGVGTGCIYIPPIQSPPAPPPPPMPAVSPYRPPSSRPAGQTKAQAVSQNIGSIYIPPIGSVPAAAPDTHSSSGGSNVSNGSVDTAARMPQSAQAAPPPPQMVPIPQTPQLNKAPIPWMNSYNRLSQQGESPPYVHPGYFMPPWAAPPPPTGARTIPIMMAREPDQTDGSQFHFDGSRPGSGGSGSTTPTGSRTPSQAATHLGRVIPIQIEREAEVRQKGAKIIPIQIEGRPPRAQTPSTPSTPAVNPMRRVVGPPPYNSPMGMYSNQNVMDAYQRQAAEAGAGVAGMTIRCESPRMEPAQSKAMRVIQQAAENELKRLEQMPQPQHRMGISEDDRYVMSLLGSQVDEGTLVYQTAEPRFMGGHIPSRAFQALQTSLPVNPGAQDQPSYPAAHSAHVTHHIPIRTVSQSPTPQSQGSELQMSNQPNVPPSEQRVQEPKKYMGSNIPSRSFKILQAMTADDGQSAVGSETASSEQIIADAYDDTLSPCPSTENVPLSPCSSSSFPLSYSSSEGGGSANFDPYSSQNASWSDMMDQGWDPYSYMWYYWWYYTSCYWAGYDMTGYEYPPGWDPNYPYCPPEFCSDYSGLSDYTTASEQCNLENTNGVSSESSSSVAAAELYKSFSENGGESYYSHDDNDDADGGRLPLQNNNNTLGTTVPKIVIEGGGGDSGTEGKWSRDRKSNVDSIKDNNNSNHNDGSTSIAPSPSTECNQKPGNPIPYKTNDCDSVGEREKTWKAEQGNFAEYKQLQNGYDNDDDEEREEAQEDSSSSEDEYESCCEDEQKVIERETGPCNKPFVSQNPDHFSGAEQQSRQRKFELHGNYNSELNANDDDDDHHERQHHQDADKEEEEDEDEKTDPGADDDNDDDYGGRVAIIEEPETPSSADDSDVAPLVNEQHPTGKSAFYSNGGLSIEEYHSEESSDSAVFDYGLKKNRLSTIDEITESRASSSLFSRNLSSELDCCVNTSNLLKENFRHQQNEAIGESEDSEESSEDELSSVSVIENKSDATRGTESKREDETTSSSEEDSSSTDDDDDDDDEAAGADTAVTVRLPLKLCFTKTKSYKDITTVMVGDSEIEKATEAVFGVDEDSYSRKENEALVHSTKYNHDNIDKLAVCDDDDDDDEPVVSFTLSLSRQPSREDEPQLNDKPNEGHNKNQEKSKKKADDDAPDIDFWAEIKGEDSTSPTPEAIQAKSNQESKEDYEGEHFETDGGFWGVIARDRSTSDFRRLRKQNGKKNESNQNSLSLEQNGELWDPHESIDYKWEKDFNFWEKSSRTIETRRFSNFEITEDYESDSGLKPSVKKERAKKYTHHKRHSIPGLPWDRASLPPRPTQKQSTFSIKTFTNEQEIEEGNVYDKTDREKTDKTSSEKRQAIDAYQDDTDASSSWWSSWEETAKESSGQKLGNNEDHACTTEKVEPGGGAFFMMEESEMDDTVESQKKEESSDISGEIKLSESECNNIGESTDGDYQSFACRQASGIETRGNGGFSSLERKNAEVKDRKSLNYSCQSDATTVTTDNEDYSSSLEIKSSLLCRGAANQEAEKLIQGSSCISVSDENSDESSSRSSGTTIGRHDKSEIKKQMLAVISPTTATTPDAKPDREEDHLKNSVQSTPTVATAAPPPLPPADTSIQIPVSIERSVEIQHELGERIKLNGKQHQEEHQHHHQHPTSALAINTTSSCTCLTGDRIARAENLLWRIERFLHESLSLGSEDDSGVMTDLSRQISDVDTDVDNDLNETEFLLTAAAAAKERRNMGGGSNKESGHIESCNFAETISSTDRTVQTTSSSTSPAPQVSPQVKKPRPKSDIILESSLTKVETEVVVEENNGVKMRSASERRALRYQRAKTHSRLFQLLQDECGRDEELDEFDYDSDVGLPANETITTDCQINVESTATKSIHVDTSTASHIHSACCSNGMDDDSNQPACPGMNDSQARRSRLLPLPIKNLLASSLSLDSNSSPSGSSGVLSPTSPVNRDQLLADIINEFHLRNQASTLRAQNQKRISNSFPSKIFKLLQHEFGEEFYQTFDCCGGVGGEDSLISPCMSTNLGSCVYDSSHAAGTAVVHECTIHKSESMKEFEEATSRILTNFMLRNKQKAPSSESPSSTATMSSQLLQDDSKKVNADFLEVPLRKKKANLNRDPRSPKSTKKS